MYTILNTTNIMRLISEKTFDNMSFDVENYDINTFDIKSINIETIEHFMNYTYICGKYYHNIIKNEANEHGYKIEIEKTKEIIKHAHAYVFSLGSQDLIEKFLSELYKIDDNFNFVKKKEDHKEAIIDGKKGAVIDDKKDEIKYENNFRNEMKNLYENIIPNMVENDGMLLRAHYYKHLISDDNNNYVVNNMNLDDETKKKLNKIINKKMYDIYVANMKNKIIDINISIKRLYSISNIAEIIRDDYYNVYKYIPETLRGSYDRLYDLLIHRTNELYILYVCMVHKYNENKTKNPIIETLDLNSKNIYNVCDIKYCDCESKEYFMNTFSLNISFPNEYVNESIYSLNQTFDLEMKTEKHNIENEDASKFLFADITVLKPLICWKNNVYKPGDDITVINDLQKYNKCLLYDVSGNKNLQLVSFRTKSFKILNEMKYCYYDSKINFNDTNILIDEMINNIELDKIFEEECMRIRAISDDKYLINRNYELIKIYKNIVSGEKNDVDIENKIKLSVKNKVDQKSYKNDIHMFLPNMINIKAAEKLNIKPNEFLDINKYNYKKIFEGNNILKIANETDNVFDTLINSIDICKNDDYYSFYYNHKLAIDGKIFISLSNILSDINNIPKANSVDGKTINYNHVLFNMSCRNYTSDFNSNVEHKITQHGSGVETQNAINIIKTPDNNIKIKHSEVISANISQKFNDVKYIKEIYTLNNNFVLLKNYKKYIKKFIIDFENQYQPFKTPLNIDDIKNKYIKYKNKYLQLKKKLYGNNL